MPYRFRPNESVTAAIRRVLRHEIDTAIAELAAGNIDRDQAIHQARKRLKKIRAILRLVRPLLPDTFDVENPFYRNLGRDLSPARDATTLVGAIDALAGHFKDTPAAIPSVREVLAARRDRVLHAGGDLNKLSRQVISGLRKARLRVAQWSLPRKGFDLIAPGLKLSYKQGRQSLKAACAEPTAENLHELRKRAKDHWYHVRLLECVWPEPIACYRDALGNLSDLLGQDHDLAVLRAALAAEPEVFGGEASLRPLVALIDQRQEQLRAESFNLARRIYAEKPNALLSRFEKYWSAMKAETTANGGK